VFHILIVIAALDFKAINISLDSFVIMILRCIKIRPVFFFI
jgi:hypothetical protein